MKKTKEIAEKTRADLLEVGLIVFNEKGYMRTRLEDVAAAAGVTRGAIYHHFGNKAKLFKYIFESQIDAIMDIFSDMLSEKENPLDALKATLIDIFKRIESDTLLTCFAELLSKTEYADELTDLRKYKDYSNDKEMRILYEALKNSKEKGLIRENINVHVFAFTLTSAIDGLFRSWVQNPHYISIKDEAENIIEYLFKGVEPA